MLLRVSAFWGVPMQSCGVSMQSRGAHVIGCACASESGHVTDRPYERMVCFYACQFFCVGAPRNFVACPCEFGVPM